MILFELFNIDFDLASLIAFLIGIFVGCALLALLYSILVLSSMKSSKYIAKSKVVEVTDDVIKEMIDDARMIYNDKNLRGAKSSVAHCASVCMNLVTDIARKFFPKSKRPLAELTIDEILTLSVYVSERINGILDRPGLRLIKKLKLSLMHKDGTDRCFYRTGALKLSHTDGITWSVDGDTVTVTASECVHAVEIESGLVAEDNYFTLLPGESRTVRLTQPEGVAVEYPITVDGYTHI